MHVYKKHAFTLVELVVVIALSALVLTIVGVFFGDFLSYFDSQKQTLAFQKNIVVDNTYLLNKISSSRRFLTTTSSGKTAFENSSAFFLDTFNHNNSPFFAVGLFHGDTKSWISSAKKDKSHIGVKAFPMYVGFAQVGSDLYFTEPGRHVIRKKDAGGAITIAYGQLDAPGYSATATGVFNMPTGLAYDSSNNFLYVTDSGNSVIRRINLSTGIITLVAGQVGKTGYNSAETPTIATAFSDAKFYFPTGLVYRGTDLYVSDSLNNRIRRIELSTSKVYTIAGTDDFSDGGDLQDASGSQINMPIGITAMAQGLVFADSANGKVRMIRDTDSKLITLAGLSLPGNQNKYSLNRYIRLDFVSQVQFRGTGILFNDLTNGVIYSLESGSDSLFGTSDDTVNKILGDTSDNLVSNGDLELPLSDPGNDILFEGGSDALFALRTSTSISPKSGSYLGELDLRGIYATGTCTFTSNPVDGDILRIGGTTIEFDDGNLVYDAANHMVPIGTTLADTIENVMTELSTASDIVVTQTGSSLSLRSKNPGNTGNNLNLSAVSSHFSVSPSGGKFSGGTSFGVGTHTIAVEKTLADKKQYALSFYLSSNADATSDVFDPLISIDFGSGNIVEKVLDTSMSWKHYRFIFTGYNPTTTMSQKIRLSFRDGHDYFLDGIEITPLGTREVNTNVKDLRIDILPSFFAESATVYNVIDLYNTRLKSVRIGDPVPIVVLINNFNPVDIRSLTLGSIADFYGSSLVEGLTFRTNSFADLLSTRIEYMIAKENSLIHIVANVARHE